MVKKHKPEIHSKVKYPSETMYFLSAQLKIFFEIPKINWTIETCLQICWKLDQRCCHFKSSLPTWPLSEGIIIGKLYYFLFHSLESLFLFVVVVVVFFCNNQSSTCEWIAYEDCHCTCGYVTRVNFLPIWRQFLKG